MKRAFDGVGNLRRQVYPSGAVTINRTHDAANRLTEVKDGSTSLATYKHIGPGSRRLSRTYTASGVKLSCGYDGDRRVTRHDHVKATGTQRIRGFSYAWDRAGNRRFERRLTVNSNASETAGPGEFYRYDSVYRLAHVDQDVASSTLDAVTNNATSVTSPLPVPATSSDFAYDAAGNRRQTSINGSTQLYELRAGLPELDAALNQYSRVGSTYQTHDQNGNTLSSSELGLQRFFDASDQLVQWTESGTSKNVRYQYDALGRRVSKRMLSGGSTWTLFFYDGWQDAEETTSGGTVVRRYVYGEGIDEVLRATIPDNASDLDDNGSTSGNVDIYYHDNSIGSVVAVTNAAGTVLESYRYEAFGQATIFDQSGAVVSTTQVGQPFMFTGRRLDWEEGSGLLYYRLRYYDPAAGRFVSRDPLGLWGDSGQNGNGQSYGGNNPVNRRDPFGLDDDMEPRLDRKPKILIYNELGGSDAGKEEVKEAAKAARAAAPTPADVAYVEDAPATSSYFYYQTHQVDVVVFIGHGDAATGGICVDGVSGEDDDVSEDVLTPAETAQPYMGAHPRVVIILGCKADQLAPGLYAAGVEEVWASDKLLPGLAMAKYAEAFILAYAQYLKDNPDQYAQAVATAITAAEQAAAKSMLNNANKNWEMPTKIDPPAQSAE